MAMRMYMQLPQGPTLFLCTILLAPAGGTLHKVRSHSSLRRHRGEEQVQVAGGHRRSDRRRVLHAHRLSDDCVGHPNDDVRVDDGGMEGNAGRGGAGRVHPRRRRCLYLSSEHLVSWGDVAEVPLALEQERQGETRQRLGKRVCGEFDFECVPIRLDLGATGMCRSSKKNSVVWRFAWCCHTLDESTGNYIAVRMGARCHELVSFGVE